MICPYCGNQKTGVAHTDKLVLEVQRIRVCRKCKRYWETLEVLTRKITPEAVDEMTRQYRENLETKQTTLHEVIEKCDSTPSKKN